MAELLYADIIGIGVDGEGDLFMALTHRDGRGKTIVFIDPENVEPIIESLRFNDACARSIKSGNGSSGSVGSA